MNLFLFQHLAADVTWFDWISILAVPPTVSSPACALTVAANVPARAVKPIFLKFVIFTPIVIVVITNKTVLSN
jgi:hypothetical protein